MGVQIRNPLFHPTQTLLLKVNTCYSLYSSTILETGDNVSVSIRRIGDDLKVPNARKGKKGVSQAVVLQKASFLKSIL